MDNQQDLFQWLKTIFFPGEEASAVKPEQDNAAKPETETARTQPVVNKSNDPEL